MAGGGGALRVSIEVPSFAEHRLGHTEYEVRVHLLNTDQVWNVYRRYSKFVHLRILLKERYCDGSSNEVADESDTITVPVILEHCKLPRRFHMASGDKLREHRREAVCHFLQLLSSVKPVPTEVAAFIGLFDDNRITRQSDGTYGVSDDHYSSTGSALLSPNTRKRTAEQRARYSSFTDEESGDSSEDDDTADMMLQDTATGALLSQQHAGGGLGVTASTPASPLRSKRRPSLDPEALLQEYIDGYLEGVIRPAVNRQTHRTLDSLKRPPAHVLAAATATVAAAATEVPPLPRETAVELLEEDEQRLRVAQLLSLHVQLSSDHLRLLLRYSDWSAQRAAAHYQELVKAGKGFLPAVPPIQQQMRGAANGGNTCYLDSLLFAMFARVSAFDWLLLKPVRKSDSPALHLLQAHLRFAVGQLRRGALITGDHANLLRSALAACGWGSHQTEGGSLSQQEDASELYSFLLSLFRSPSLPLSEKLFHGGTAEELDEKIASERVLHLSLPPPLTDSSSSSGSGSDSTGSSNAAAAADGGSSRVKGGSTEAAPVTLEQVLRYNLFDSRVEGLRREVSGEGERQVAAWRQIMLLPFFTLGDEHGEHQHNKQQQRQRQQQQQQQSSGSSESQTCCTIEEADANDDYHYERVMLPLVLKRCYMQQEPSQGGATPAMLPVRSTQPVIVPHKLDFSDFISPEEARAVQAGRFVLVLRAAVCHRGGSSVHSGHYIAVAALHEAAAAASGEQLPPSPLLHASAGAGAADSSSSSSGLSRSDSEALDPAPEVEGGWLMLDDLQSQGKIDGSSNSSSCFVRALTTPTELSQLFGKDLAMDAYMLFYEVIDAKEVGGMRGGRVSGRVLAGLRESSDLALAQQLHEAENSSHKDRHRNCPVS